VNVHLGFGEAGLPVLPELADMLAAASPLNAYEPVTGTSNARRAAAGYFARRNLPTDPDQIIVAPGSKALLYALIAAIPGDVVLPQPSWVTYAAQAALAGKHVMGVPVPQEAGGVPDPGELDRTLREARTAGHRPGTLVLTLPDNPTGTLAGADLVEQVCAVAAEHDLAIISDEIYRDLAYRTPVTSPATILPDRCFVTGGLSKNMALGGWRIGFTRLPDNELGRQVRREVIGIASEVWSSLAAPMQKVISHVLDEPPEVTAHIAASRALHERVATVVQGRFAAAGVEYRKPQGAVYLYPDFEPLRPALTARGVRDADGLAEYLLDQHGIGVLSGAAFGDDPAGLRFRAATSLLYGTTNEQRWTALRSADPTALPWIAGALDQLNAALDDIRKP
jgi:aspartate aminotransferase